MDVSNLPKIPVLGWRYQPHMLGSGQVAVKIVDVWGHDVWVYEGTAREPLAQLRGSFHPNELAWLSDLSLTVFRALNPGKRPRAEGPTFWDRLGET